MKHPWTYLTLAGAALAALLLLGPGLLPSVGLPGGMAATTYAADAAGPAYLDASFLRNSYWYDGSAEINLYEATLTMYGAPRQADEVAHVVVSERHQPDSLVKADDWRAPGLVEMIKLNYVTRVQTGIYPYQQMLSFFFRQNDARLAKMTLTSNEWCGNSFKELVNDGRAPHYRYNTYWDGQGHGAYELAEDAFPAGMTVYEALPVHLRALPFRDGLRVELPLLPRQLTSRVQPPSIETATLDVHGPIEFEVPAGTYASWQVALDHAGGRDTLYFERDFPHRLLAWDSAFGHTFRLRTSAKLPYWQLNGVGGEEALAFVGDRIRGADAAGR
ncbi:MAG: hypothetical protein AAF772_06025 [Acidobacteriota bacterium]